jgi:hypothetical protein
MSILKITWTAVNRDSENISKIYNFNIDICTSEFSEEVENILESINETKDNKKQLLVDTIDKIVKDKFWWNKYQISFDFYLENLSELRLYSLVDKDNKTVEFWCSLLPSSLNFTNLLEDFEKEIYETLYVFALENWVELEDKEEFIFKLKNDLKLTISEVSSIYDEVNIISGNETIH